MKLTEVSKERTFNLEISETDLRDLLAVVSYWPVDPNEYYTDKSTDVIHGFYGLCESVYVHADDRADYVETI